MSFVQCELGRIRSVISSAKSEQQYSELYAAQQALSWALDQSGFASPSSAILGTPAEKEGCSVEPHPALFSNIHVLPGS